MKKMIAWSMLVLSACAAPAGAVRRSVESFAGPWHGVLAKADGRVPADFRFSEGERGYQGFFWGRQLTPIALSNLQLVASVHFEMPGVGNFVGGPNRQDL